MCNSRVFRPWLTLLASRRGADSRIDEESGHEVARWNLRKCSAAALDVLSTVFEEDLLPIVSPVVEQRLQASRAAPFTSFSLGIAK